MPQKEGKLKVEVGISLDELVAAVKSMKKEDREWFLENLLASTSSEYLKSIKEARKDYQEGNTIEADELFKD